MPFFQSAATRAREFDRAYDDLKHASELLRDDNLVWSEDFEAIRRPLAAWLGTQKYYGIHADPNAREVAARLLEPEYDISLG